MSLQQVRRGTELTVPREAVLWNHSHKWLNAEVLVEEESGSELWGTVLDCSPIKDRRGY
jgi:hypothetical protein